MSTTADRLRLYEHARETWGDDPARTLMDLLPPDPQDLATKADVALTRSELHGEMGELRVEMAELRTELRGEMGELRVEMGELRVEMAELRTELRGEMGELRVEMAELRTELCGEMGELRVDLTQQMAEQTRTLVLAMVGMVLTVLTLSLGAVAFG